LKDQLQSIQIQSILGVNVADPKTWYFSDLDFIILFIDILSLYTINLGVVSLFVYSPFTILAIFVFDVLYQFE